MRLLVDVDGVLADQISPVLEKLNRKYNLSVTKDQIKRWNEPIGDTDIKIEIEKFFLDSNNVLAMKLIDSAREAMVELATKHEIVIATNRHTRVDDATEQWLRDNGIPFDHYVNTSVCGKENIAGDILIDDYPDNVLRFAKRNNVAILFDQPWNRAPMLLRTMPSLAGRVVRAQGWQSVLQIVNSLETSGYLTGIGG